MRGGFRTVAIRVDRRLYSVHEKFVDAVLEVGRQILRVKQAPIVGFVLAEKQIRHAFAIEPSRSVVVMVELDRGEFR